MKTATVYTNEILNRVRLDSSFYLSDGNRAYRLVESALREAPEHYSMGDKELVSIWQPNRNVLVYAGAGEPSVPYLQPYDILEYLPGARSYISQNQNPISELKVQSGTILQTCSGRNLGPLIISDKYLEQFAFGSDLLRIDIFDETIKYYIFAFFNTWIGQALLHSSKTGSVIDHLSAKDIESIRIPSFGKDIVKLVSEKMRLSFQLYSDARIALERCIQSFQAAVSIETDSLRLCEGWNVSVKDFWRSKRIDAAFFDPSVSAISKRLSSSGGCSLNEVADILKPSGRYKTNYVKKEFGQPIISGRQLLQNQIVGLKYLPRSAMENFADYRLSAGWIAYPADGRVEGRLGTPIMVTRSRDGWYASGHVGRIVPHSNIDPGYVYLAVSHPAVQAQICSLACGSVVDAVYPEDVEKITIPAKINFPYEQVVDAWNNLDKANQLKEESCAILLNCFQDRIS